MPFQSQFWFGVDQFGVAEDFLAQFRQTRVVLLQLFASIHMIVIVIRWTVIVESRLYAFRPVFVVV